MSLSTYDIQRLAHELVDTLEDAEGESCDELDARLAEYAEAADSKLGALWHVRNRMLTEITHEDEAMKRRRVRRDRTRKALERIESLAMSIMLANEVLTGDVKHAGDGFGLRISESVRAIVPTDPVGVLGIPEAMRRHTPEKWTADKAEIKKALKAGSEIAGCSLQTKQGLRWA